jgi:hypothetical protein
MLNTEYSVMNKKTTIPGDKEANGVAGQVVTLAVPQSLYRQAARIARFKNQAIPEVLAEALLLVEAEVEEEAEEELMAQEEAAYQAMQSDLWTKYPGEYVAIYQGELVDHDSSELALLQRLNARYPNEVVLMKQVRSLPEPDLYLRSPRFVRDV